LTTLRSYVPTRAALRRPLSPIDVAVLIAVLVLLYAVLRVGHGATATFSPAALERVSTNPARLPYDAALSLLRMFIALFFSTVFTLVYGYAAARSRRAEKVLVPILDILQSVPVLGFLTITVTAFIALFPGSELGLEAASIFAIFTAQAWNMTFSFYASLKNLPRELDELSRSLRLTRWQRFWKMEVPSGAIGLVWNGMLSFGGSWFFLVASEAISVHNHTYSLAGIGSFVGAAIAKGDLGAVGLAIATMIAMVIAVNVVFWRPLVAWSERYRYETTEAAETQRSLVLELLARSSWPRVLGRLRARLAEPLGRAMRILGRDDAPPAVIAARQRAGDAVFARHAEGRIALFLHVLEGTLGNGDFVFVVARPHDLRIAGLVHDGHPVLAIGARLHRFRDHVAHAHGVLAFGKFTVRQIAVLRKSFFQRSRPRHPVAPIFPRHVQLLAALQFFERGLHVRATPPARHRLADRDRAAVDRAARVRHDDVRVDFADVTTPAAKIFFVHIVPSLRSVRFVVRSRLRLDLGFISFLYRLSRARASAGCGPARRRSNSGPRGRAAAPYVFGSSSSPRGARSRSASSGDSFNSSTLTRFRDLGFLEPRPIVHGVRICRLERRLQRVDRCSDGRSHPASENPVSLGR